jgi:hypothetical protein
MTDEHIETGPGSTAPAQPNNRVEKFDSSGKYLSQFGGFGTGPGQMHGPEGIALDPNTNPSGDRLLRDAMGGRSRAPVAAGRE